MYRIAVCDDEDRISEEVSRLIREWNPEIQVDCFSGGEALVEHYIPYDAIFLDIDMQGMNGIETGRRIRSMDTETKIVYLTAYRDYVSGAFGVHAFQYLLKPVAKTAVWNVLKEIFRYIKTPEEKIILSFKTTDGIVCMPVSEIYFFEYENRKVRMVTAKEEYYLADRIGNIEKQMREYGFSMPHQSFVLNMRHVKNVRGQQILMDNGMEAPLSQKKQKTWKQELIGYLSSRIEGKGGGGEP